MIPLSQYIEQRIETLNQLDHEMARLRESISPTDGQALPAALQELSQARNTSDQRLFDLFSIRSAKLATPQLIAASETAWNDLRIAWHRVISLLSPPISAPAQRISDLLAGSAGTDKSFA